MPQMFPLNWLMLFFLFILVYIMIMIMNYYSFIYKPKMMKNNPKKSSLNWKW
uniref:ATP synthase F0 subunit 8 n=1 Tax=Callirhopalus sedakowii TaxID=2919454 RepID=UPI00207AAD12|nr:ATP synthase F0 subunit 8 [Callirhopalus sedakowii]URN73816.1 ATP synthase F0 subunit 8 [Callirhopalus sedakowii]